MKRLLLASLLCSACTVGPPRPVAIDTAHDTCEYCRMIVSDPRLAAEIVAPGEEALVFDDLGCLRDYLATHPQAQEMTVFVVEHRTGAWIDARSATYTRTRTTTPMASGIVAHADSRSRALDPLAADGASVDVAAILHATPAAGERR